MAAVALTASPAAAAHDYHQGMPSRYIDVVDQTETGDRWSVRTIQRRWDDRTDVVFPSVSSCRSTRPCIIVEGRVEPLR